MWEPLGTEKQVPAVTQNEAQVKPGSPPSGAATASLATGCTWGAGARGIVPYCSRQGP